MRYAIIKKRKRYLRNITEVRAVLCSRQTGRGSASLLQRRLSWKVAARFGFRANWARELHFISHYLFDSLWIKKRKFFSSKTINFSSNSTVTSSIAKDLR